MHAPPDAWGKRESLVDAEVFFGSPDMFVGHECFRA